jgi:regulator of nucleoside diphosphate kinase
MNNEHRNRFESFPEITVTRENLWRLDTMLVDHAPIRSWRAVELLVRELMRAKIVDPHAVPPQVATMGSRVAFREKDDRMPGVLTLAYPGTLGLYEDAISVLTPIGAVLLGLSEGQSMCYPGPDGKPKSITLIKVLYQPESTRRAQSHLPGMSRPSRLGPG